MPPLENVQKIFFQPLPLPTGGLIGTKMFVPTTPLEIVFLQEVGFPMRGLFPGWPSNLGHIVLYM